jgi:biopolymer transport protein ExbD
VFWNGEIVDRTQMLEQMARAAHREPQPELHLRADKTTQYQLLAEVMAAAGRAGITRIGFVSVPVPALP